MGEVQSRDLSEFVTLSDTTLTTDSRRVAKHFNKRHDNVLRAIDGLECSDEFRSLNFEDSLQINDLANGKRDRLVLMTKDGFMFLCMSFTGKKAASIKEAYIGAFNAMASQLQRLSADSYRRLWDERLELEKTDATTFMWASFGSKRMRERRKALPGIKGERGRLEAAMQPPLFAINEEKAVTQ